MDNEIKYNDILLLIRNEIIETMEDNYHYYKEYDVVIAPEQEFIKQAQKDPKKIYIVVTFGATAVTFGQIVLPISFRVMSESNKLEVAQNLLTEFAFKYNLHYDGDDGKIYQIFETPTVTSNFNLVHDGFRSILSMSGTLLISSSIIPVKISYFDDETGEEEPLNVINYTDSLTVSLDSQPFTNSDIAYNFSQSVAKFGTFSFVIVLFLQNTAFINKVLDIKYIDLDKAPLGVDTPFKMSVRHKNTDKGYIGKTFRMTGLSTTQSIGQQPTISISFTF